MRWIGGALFFGVSLGYLFAVLFFVSREAAYRSARVLFGIQNRLMGIDLVVRGQEHIEPGRTYIVMGNHQSLFDVFVIPVGIVFPFVGVEAAYHFNWPFWGWLVKAWGNIPIRRGDLQSALASIRKAEEHLRRGGSIGILPEGHRTRDGRIGAFKKGPFHMALNTRATILPFGINGLFEYCPRGSFLLKPRKVTLAIGNPIEPEAYMGLDVEGLSDLVEKRIRNLARC